MIYAATLANTNASAYHSVTKTYVIESKDSLCRCEHSFYAALLWIQPIPWLDKLSAINHPASIVLDR
jgi:hypothetical protein